MALDDFVRQLRQIELFQLLSPDALRLIAFSAENRILQPGDILFEEGEPADSGVIVLGGALILTKLGAPGDKHRVEAGALVGEMALILETKRPATATAGEITGILRVPRSLFQRVLHEFPDCSLKLRDYIASRTREATAILDAFREVHLR